MKIMRQVIQIDEEKCTGCRLCVDACHEGALGIVDGKAKLLRDDFCDGMGDCLPACPTDAISFVQREALPYNEDAVAIHKELKQSISVECPAGGCPGTAPADLSAQTSEPVSVDLPNRLGQWPCQIKLVPMQAPYFQGCDLLVAADCTAFACASFHERYMKDKITIVGCPKLDSVDYSEKLTSILTLNDIRSIVIARMEVPCCGGLERAVRMAAENCGKNIPLEVVTFSVRGDVL